MKALKFHSINVNLNVFVSLPLELGIEFTGHNEQVNLEMS